MKCEGDEEDLRGSLNQVRLQLVNHLYSESSQNAETDLKFLTYDRQYDNVLPGQGCRIPDGTVIDECGVMMIRRGKPKNCWKFLQCYSVYQESGLKSTGD